ncbi:hypothetical protein [Nitrobacter sp. TKz-YC02]|uniref:hypothetical protein n=1 Tax=Nitrobacter sp. TKz-YC02 TaxID=3398704 RepID=UPI003CEE44B5
MEAEFNAFIVKFRAALKANDPTAVASMTKLPFMGDKAYADAAQFRAKAYPEFFSAKDRACIQRKKAEYFEMARTTTTTLSSAARAFLPSPERQPDSF